MTKIYESPDRGKTVYIREFHSLNRKLYHRGKATSLVNSVVKFLKRFYYKSLWAGRTYHRINKWYPSSKTCSCCDHKLDRLDLETREWTCPNCGSTHDRDINAATNILRVGQIDCYGEAIQSQAIGDLGEIPLALQKMTDKIERSGIRLPVSHGSGQAARSLVV